jgi:putative ABC transport system ATP-binding protein
VTLTCRCEDLAVGWAGTPLIAGLTFDFQLAKLNYALPIIGRTGHGKSTLLYALAGMSQPMFGSVVWTLPDQQDEISWTPQLSSFGSINELRRKKFGFLLQDATMIPCFTVAENLRHILNLRDVRDDLEDRIVGAIEKMLIEGETVADFYDQYPARLSGGMRQRMALAAAIAHDPQVLFADEPTASLDDESGMEVLRVVRRWLDEKAGQRAFIFVTHRVETLRGGAGATSALRIASEVVDGVANVAPRMEVLMQARDASPSSFDRSGG